MLANVYSFSYSRPCTQYFVIAFSKRIIKKEYINTLQYAKYFFDKQTLRASDPGGVDPDLSLDNKQDPDTSLKNRIWIQTLIYSPDPDPT